MEIEIINMYPDILNLYGDIGNLICIKKRCEWREINVNVRNFTMDSEIDIQSADMILIGGGSDNGQEIISNHILNQKKALENFIEDNKVLLAICGSYQMFGNSYINPYDEKIPCLEIFDIETKSKEDRLTGNIVLSNNLNLESFHESNLNYIIGFENHGGRTYHNYDTLGDVKLGFGNNGEDKKEGMIYKNFIGSYLHGPLLPKNPHLTDYLIYKSLKNRYGKNSLEEKIEENNLELNNLEFSKEKCENKSNFGMSEHTMDDSIEIDAHNIMLQKLLKE